MKIHEKAEKNEPLTGDVLTEMYADILNTYYGHDKGVCHIDDLYHVEWAYIPHFYYNFYVYQYATSLTASTALAEKILNKEKGMVKKYIDFLSTGGSDYPIDILKTAGVDMTTSEPFEKTMAAMNRTMDEIEAILETRDSLDAEQKETTAWLIIEEVLDLKTYIAIAPRITARGQQFMIESLGFSDHVGMVSRLQVIVDMVGPIAQTIYYRDLTYVGGNFPIREEDRESVRVR